MKFIQKPLHYAFSLGLLALAMYAIVHFLTGEIVNIILHKMAFYLPAVGLLGVISGQVDLGASIEVGKEVNIRARCLDFIHWFLLIFLNIGAWKADGVSVSWFALKVVLVGIIGWQIGIGVKRLWQPSRSDKVAGILTLTASMTLGLVAGYIRNIDQTDFGWGWWIETVTAVLATGIVFYWIREDMKTISQKAAGYPRSLFWKGIFSNNLVLLFWIHMLTYENIGAWDAGVKYLGMTVNVTVGNVLYLLYYWRYEYYRRLQDTA